jgi:anti-sigma B factor antagonist
MLGRQSRGVVTEALKGISVGLTDNEVYVRVVGRGTFQNGQPLRRYALEMIERGVQRFVIDLGGCDGMDSTFLGVLAGIGLRLTQNGRPGQVRIANLSSRNSELLQTLGLDRLLVMDAKTAGELPSGPPTGIVMQRLPDSDITRLSKTLSKGDTADLMLDAHESLIRADQGNLAKFKDLTSFLREKVDKGGDEGHKNE